MTAVIITLCAARRPPVPAGLRWMFGCCGASRWGLVGPDRRSGSGAEMGEKMEEKEKKRVLTTGMLSEMKGKKRKTSSRVPPLVSGKGQGTTR